MKPPRPFHGRICRLCRAAGGVAATTLLRDLGVNIGDGELGYAHARCIMKLQKKGKTK